MVFLSSDENQQSFDGYFGSMPWLALPYDQRGLKETLSKKYKVKGIPTLVLIDGETATTLSADGIETVMGDPKGIKVCVRCHSFFL